MGLPASFPSKFPPKAPGTYGASFKYGRPQGPAPVRLAAPGRYYVEISEIKYIDATENKYHCDIFAVEGKVIESENDTIKVGDTFRRSDFKSTSSPAAEEAFYGNIKRLIGVVKGVKAYTVTPEMIKSAIDNQELKGVQLAVVAEIVPSKEDPTKPRLNSQGNPVPPRLTFIKI